MKRSYLPWLHRFTLVVVLLASFALNGCAGAIQSAAPAASMPVNSPQILREAVIPLQAGTVAYQIGQALEGKLGTQILLDQSASRVIFFWSQNGIGTGMFAIDLKSKSFPDVFKLIRTAASLSIRKRRKTSNRCCTSRGGSPSAQVTLSRE